MMLHSFNDRTSLYFTERIFINLKTYAIWLDFLMYLLLGYINNTNRNKDIDGALQIGKK